MTPELKKQAFQAMILALSTPVRPFLVTGDKEIGGVAEHVNEIMINGPKKIYVDIGKGPELQEGLSFRRPEDLRAMARAILQYSGKRLTPFDLSLEARLPDGSRVHIVQDPASTGGLSITIRRFGAAGLKLDEMVPRSMSQDMADLLKRHVAPSDGAEPSNIVISGGTGTGKTTLLGALAGVCSKDERVITIEDVAELNLPLPHVVSLETQMPDNKGRGGISLRDLFRATLRMRPDRIIVGECRGGEALDMIQAMNSGHRGSLTTVHADDAARALSRLETLCLMADVDIPLEAVRRQIFEAIDIVVQIERVHVPGGKDVRRVKEIGKMRRDAPFEGGLYPLDQVYPGKGQLI